ncbi:MAG: hypothetical protein V4462_04425, partial [Pseudomonadota bacterium]
MKPHNTPALLAPSLLLSLLVGLGAVQAVRADDRSRPASAADAAVGVEHRSLAPFSAIDVSGPYQLVVSAQGERGLDLRGPSKQFADLDSKVVGETLVLRPVKRVGWSGRTGRLPWWANWLPRRWLTPESGIEAPWPDLWIAA